MGFEIKRGSKRLREFRFSYPFAFYHVSTAKAAGACQLDDPVWFEVVGEELSQLEEEGLWQCLALVLMPTHLHMIVRLGRGGDLSRAMKLFKGRTAHRINELKGGSGSIWFKGFHERLIRDNEKLSGYYNYILKNPVMAHLCATPAEYPYFRIKPEIQEFL